MTDYAHRRLIDESARRRTSTGPVDFMPINDSTGETVLVPIGSSLTRCGISDPVIKIACSSTFCLGFEAWLMFGSASTVPANSAAIIAVAAEHIRVFTTNKVTPAKVLCANYRNDEDGPFLQKQERAVALDTAPSRTN